MEKCLSGRNVAARGASVFTVTESGRTAADYPAVQWDEGFVLKGYGEEDRGGCRGLLDHSGRDVERGTELS